MYAQRLRKVDKNMEIAENINEKTQKRRGSQEI
jgi:hypothetical protein